MVPVYTGQAKRRIKMKYKSFNILCLTMVAAIMLTAPVRVWGATVGTLDIRVSASNDDVEEDISDGSIATDKQRPGND